VSLTRRTGAAATSAAAYMSQGGVVRGPGFSHLKCRDAAGSMIAALAVSVAHHGRVRRLIAPMKASYSPPSQDGGFVSF
jgi:hypothetical protein